MPLRLCLIWTMQPIVHGGQLYFTALLFVCVFICITVVTVNFGTPNVTVPESSGTFMLCVDLDKAAAIPVTVDIDVQEGSATEGSGEENTSYMPVFHESVQYINQPPLLNAVFSATHPVWIIFICMHHVLFILLATFFFSVFFYFLFIYLFY